MAQDLTICTIQFWAPKSYERIAILKGHDYGILCLAILSDNQIISVSEDLTLRIRNIKNYKCEAILRGHSFLINCVATLNNIIISGSSDLSIKVWKSDGECITTLRNHTSGVSCLAFY